MFERILRRMQADIRDGAYTLSYHARIEMEDDAFTVYDLEWGMLSGTIVERQRDRVTREATYRIRGIALDEREMEIIAKRNATGHLVIITVYEL
ncbi:DUF4258 domain-containing protein [Candidatus Entotheonella palauensis]|uniref:DUF4258 domain-containing protein n=1 Tax=Candidatus Entotheonella palauensis TaxID=93172 RepID=UPI000B7F4884|nr:DUF4258 domain-containing protein [Candidatus Entotheonella palauensis]